MATTPGGAVGPQLPIPPAPNNPITANSTNPAIAGVAGTSWGSLVTGFPSLSTNVGVFGAGTTGVQGVSAAGVGVLGQSNSATAAAIHGVSTAFDAVVGETSSAAHAGVTGRITNAAPGLFACAIFGDAAGHGGLAGKFDGALQVNGNATVTGFLSVSHITPVLSLTINGDAHVTGTHTVDGDIVLSAAASDCAEEFEIRSVADSEPGTVMVLDDAGVLKPSSGSYDKKVAGVISGAGCYRPGIILGRGEGSPTRLPVALVGKVFCKVDAQYGPIEVGDLLTTSPTPGYAMSVQDRSLAFGAVIGKALGGLSHGCGLVPILVALQ